MLSVVHPPGSRRRPRRTVAGNVIIEAQWPIRSMPTSTSGSKRRATKPVRLFQQERHRLQSAPRDLGMPQDVTNLNYEVAYSRGMPAGDMSPRHMYRGVNVAYPVTVKVVARVKPSPTMRPRACDRHVSCDTKRPGDGLRFQLDSHGRLWPGASTASTRNCGRRAMILSRPRLALLLGTFIFLVLRGDGCGSVRHRQAFSRSWSSSFMPARPSCWSAEAAAPGMAQCGACAGARLQHARNEAIYLWLHFDDGSEPRAYRLPWSMQAAQQLRRLRRRGGQRHRRADDHDRRGRARSREPKFYATPSLPCPTELHAHRAFGPPTAKTEEHDLRAGGAGC